MENFWDYSVWGFLNIFAVLLLSLLAGNIIKKAVPILKASVKSLRRRTVARREAPCLAMRSSWWMWGIRRKYLYKKKAHEFHELSFLYILQTITEIFAELFHQAVWPVAGRFETTHEEAEHFWFVNELQTTDEMTVVV